MVKMVKGIPERTEIQLERHETIDALEKLFLVYTDNTNDLKKDVNAIIELMKRLLEKINVIYDKHTTILDQTLALTPNINMNAFRDDIVVWGLIGAFIESQNMFQSKLSSMADFKRRLENFLSENRVKKNKNRSKRH